MAGNVQNLTDSNFDATVQNGVTLVDFWAPWCPPCRMQGPVVESLADKYHGKAVIAKMNTDEESLAASRFNIDSIPTLIIMKNGKEVKRLVGLQQQETLAAELDSFLQ